MLLDWSLTIPFAIKRNITDLKNFPVLLYDEESIQKMLCGESIAVNTLAGQFIHQNQTPLSHLYAFRLTQDKIFDESQQLRDSITSNSKCTLRK